MPQEIEIGKKYRLNIVPNAEYRCPLCDRDLGLSWLAHAGWTQGQTVTVTGPSSETVRDRNGCDGEFDAPEGLYGIDWGCAVPYTWLIPLEATP